MQENNENVFQCEEKYRLLCECHSEMHAHCAYIMPVLTCGATFWSANLTDVKPLEKVQHKITRWILGTSHHSYKKHLILIDILPVTLYNEMDTLLSLARILAGKFSVNRRDFAQ